MVKEVFLNLQTKLRYMGIPESEAAEFYTEEKCFITEIINSEDSPGVSMARARVEPGVTTQLHVLDIDEIYHILEGRGLVEVNEVAREVKKGDSVFIKAGSSQRITNTADTDLIFLCICHPRFKPESYTSLE